MDTEGQEPVSEEYLDTMLNEKTTHNPLDDIPEPVFRTEEEQRAHYNNLIEDDTWATGRDKPTGEETVTTATTAEQAAPPVAQGKENADPKGQQARPGRDRKKKENKVNEKEAKNRKLLDVKGIKIENCKK